MIGESRRWGERSRRVGASTWLAGLVAALLLVHAPAFGDDAAPAIRGVSPAWVAAGKATTVRVYGQNLKADMVESGDIGERVGNVEPFAARNDDEKAWGNSKLTLTLTVPAALRPGHYKFTLSGKGTGAADGWITVVPPAGTMKSVEPNNTLNQPQALPRSAVMIDGKLDDGVDVFRIDGLAGERWRFEIFAKRLRPGAKLEPVLRLRDPHRTIVRAAVDEGSGCFIEQKITEPGPYLLELFDGDNQAGADLAYTLLVCRT